MFTAATATNYSDTTLFSTQISSKSAITNSCRPWLLEINLSPSLAADSPLDLKIKGNLLKDTFNLVGLKTQQPENRDTGTKRMGTLKKKAPDSNSKVLEELSQQTKEFDEFNWIQKEYINTFIALNTRHKEIICETLLEYQRRGNFVRIYPTKNSDFYDCFLS